MGFELGLEANIPATLTNVNMTLLIQNHTDVILAGCSPILTSLLLGGFRDVNVLSAQPSPSIGLAGTGGLTTILFSWMG